MNAGGRATNIQFAEADILTEFGNGKTITCFISSTVAGLTAMDFANLDSGSTLYSAAAIDDANKGTWVGTGSITTAMPEAGTALAGALLLLPFGLSARRMLRKQPAA
jgi:hypothetical protein